jgi:hypothetical protein
MKSNCSVTIYNKYVGEDRSEHWQRNTIEEVEWENSKAANVRSTGGYLEANAATLYILFSWIPLYVKPKAFQALEDKSEGITLAVEDVVVKGIVEDEIEGAFTISRLKDKYDDVFVVKSVDTMDYGSANMQHWEVGVK